MGADFDLSAFYRLETKLVLKTRLYYVCREIVALQIIGCVFVDSLVYNLVGWCILYLR